MKDLNLLDDELKSYLKLSNHIKANDPKFWKKLRKSMPYKKSEEKTKKNQNDEQDDDDEVELLISSF